MRAHRSLLAVAWVLAGCASDGPPKRTSPVPANGPAVSVGWLDPLGHQLAWWNLQTGELQRIDGGQVETFGALDAGSKPVDPLKLRIFDDGSTLWVDGTKLLTVTAGGSAAHRDVGGSPGGVDGTSIDDYWYTVETQTPIANRLCHHLAPAADLCVDAPENLGTPADLITLGDGSSYLNFRGAGLAHVTPTGTTMVSGTPAGREETARVVSFRRSASGALVFTGDSTAFAVAQDQATLLHAPAVIDATGTADDAYVLTFEFGGKTDECHARPLPGCTSHTVWQQFVVFHRKGGVDTELAHLDCGAEGTCTAFGLEVQGGTLYLLGDQLRSIALP